MCTYSIILLSNVRLEPHLIDLKAKIAATDKPEERSALEKKVHEHEQFLRPIYQQIAIGFADLHDTPERMLEKGVIQVGCNSL